MILIHALLAIMLVSYAIPIGIVWYQCARATSVSQIICKNKTGIIAAMAVMAIATCAYEHQRVKCASIEHAHLHKIGFACIVSLLICIFSLVSIDESHATHYVFAVLGFGAIIAFRADADPRVRSRHCNAIRSMRSHNAPIHNRWRHIFGGSGVHRRLCALLSVSSLDWVQRMADSAAICSSVSDVGSSMENRILSAPLSL